MFENLRNAVNRHFDEAAEKYVNDLAGINCKYALDHWYYRDQMTAAAFEMVKAADPADPIPASAAAKMIKRFNASNEKNRAQYLGRLDRAENAAPLDNAVIVVTWAKSRTWGYNPTAVVTCNGDSYRQTEDSASGCGYDKESAAICGAFAKNPVIMRAIYEHAERGGKFPYSVNTYAGIPYFDGGCGVSCNYNVFDAIGYKFSDVSHSRSGNRADVYQITKA